MAGSFSCYEVSDHTIDGRKTLKHIFGAPKVVRSQLKYRLDYQKSKNREKADSLIILNTSQKSAVSRFSTLVLKYVLELFRSIERTL